MKKSKSYSIKYLTRLLLICLTSTPQVRAFSDKPVTPISHVFRLPKQTAINAVKLSQFTSVPGLSTTGLDSALSQVQDFNTNNVAVVVADRSLVFIPDSHLPIGDIDIRGVKYNLDTPSSSEQPWVKPETLRNIYKKMNGKDVDLGELFDSSTGRKQYSDANPFYIGLAKLQPQLVYSQSIDLLAMKSTINKNLKKAGINTIGDLLGHSQHELSLINGFGHQSMYLLAKSLGRFGLKLAKSPEQMPLEVLNLSDYLNITLRLYPSGSTVVGNQPVRSIVTVADVRRVMHNYATDPAYHIREIGPWAQKMINAALATFDQVHAKK